MHRGEAFYSLNLQTHTPPPGSTQPDDKGKKKKKEKVKTELVPFFELFYFADTLDWCLMALGSFAGCCTGVAMPLFMLIFGQILGKYVGKRRISL